MSFLSQAETAQQTDGSAVPAEFPGASDRFARMWSRFAGKPASFLGLGLLFALTSAGGQLAPSLVAGAGFAPLIARAGFGVPAAFLGMALAVCAAFKAGFGKSLGVGFKRGLGLIGIGLALLMVLVLPTLLFVVPGVILCFRFMLAVPVYVVERRGGFEALHRSRDLVYGKTRTLFLEWLAVGLLPALVVAGIQTGVRLVAGGAADPKALGPAIAAVGVGALLQAFFLPILFIYLQVFYEDRIASEGADWVADPRRSKFYGALGTAGFLAYIVLAGAAGPAMRYAATRFGGASAPPAHTSFPAANAPAPAANVPAPQPEPKRELTPADRDLARYGDVNTIKLALTSYRGDKAEYPASLDELAPKYVSVLPKDPSTGSSYGYEKVGLSYKLLFTLETGVFALAKGPHFLTPEGFDAEPIQSKAPPPGASSTSVVPAPEQPSTPGNPIPSEPQPIGTQPEQPPSGEPAPGGALDADGDGLNDTDELALGTDPNAKDTDGDGLDDGDEVHIKTNPTSKDTDGDGLDDRAEIYVWQTNPLNPDSDGDGFTDGDEVDRGYDPKAAGAKLPDGDADGLPDALEAGAGTDPAIADTDKDGLSDGDEKKVFATDPAKADTDGDGFGDLQEIRGGFDPTGPGNLTAERRAIFKANATKYGIHAPTPSDLVH